MGDNEDEICWELVKKMTQKKGEMGKREVGKSREGEGKAERGKRKISSDISLF